MRTNSTLSCNETNNIYYEMVNLQITAEAMWREGDLCCQI